ncbi:uncharacterized protein LOC114863098 [Betta splendens]|uniref:Uncharacterized protein LOC114863098 n=1 Tax=Betta splendens TaxID=158456 RepID=A0A6P7NQG5_BETSP|nr:uncharacterized protein LOC114863098 [Betta splendens]
MFSARTRAVVKSLGAEGDLIYNENINETIKMLTLVKVKQKRFWPVVTYTIIDQTLLDLLEDEADVPPDYTEDVLTENFKNHTGRYSSHCAAAQYTVTRPKPKKLKKKSVEMLKVKKCEKLMFVYQIVYNSSSVEFCGKVGQHASVSTNFKSFFKLNVLDTKEEETTFTVPQESTLAYGLMQISTEDGTLGIPPRTRKLKQYNKGWWNFSQDGEEEGPGPTLPQVNREIQMKGRVLQPLEDLPASTRSDLLKTMSELLEDRRALALLEQTLDQDATEPCNTKCQPVSLFMDLLEASGASTSQRDAAHLLISAMNTLPDDVPARLIRCHPDVLTILNQLVDGQIQLAELLPPPLQEEGELRWAAQLLCCSPQMLTELSEQWDRPELPVGVLLEVLALVVRGLSLMQPSIDP